MALRGLQTSSGNRLEALKSKHMLLEGRIRDEENRPLPSHMLLRQLKLEKLQVKEILEDAQRA